MIRTESEYNVAKNQLANATKQLEESRRSLEAEGLSNQEIETGVSSLFSIQSQLIQDITWYEDAKRGDFEKIADSGGLGQLLIALRIAEGITQKELADRLGVSEAQVSRDERNEYYNVTYERALKVARALGKELHQEVRSAEVDQSKELTYA